MLIALLFSSSTLFFACRSDDIPSLEEEKNVSGNKIFDQSKIHEIRIVSLAPNAWTTLDTNYKNKDYLEMKVTIDGETLNAVGVRIKGNNYREKNVKFQAFKLDFNEFKKGQKYDGLKKINLNNRNKLANTLAYKLCNNMGLPASRTSFAKLYFDDDFVGNYIILEQIDSKFIKQNFNNKNGTLIKASGKGGDLSYLGDKTEAYHYPYEFKTNKEQKDYTNLISFLNFLSESNLTTFENEVNSKLDLNVFLTALSVEMILGKQDSFYEAGRNYYLYFDTIKYVYIVDDFDYSFELNYNLNIKGENKLVNRIIQIESLKQQYLQKICDVYNLNFKNNKLLEYADEIINFASQNNFNLEESTLKTNDEIKSFISNKNTVLESLFSKNNFNCKLVQ